MTAEKLSAYVRLPYVDSISTQPPPIRTTSNSPGQEHENSLKKAKLCQPTGIHIQNQYNLEDD